MSLLSQAKAAKYCGLSANRFRRVLRKGEGPRVWNPDDGLALYATSVLDEWMHQRDDRPEMGAAS